MRIRWMMLVAAALPVPVFAQQAAASTEQPDGPWTGELSLELSPRIGKPLPANADGDLIDEGEYGIGFALSRKRASGLLAFQLKGGAAYSPQIFDREPAESSVYAEATVGDTYLSFQELRRRLHATKAGDVEDAIRPYARYRFSKAFAGLLGATDRDEHQVTGGLRYRDVQTIMCDAPDKLPADMVGPCSDTPGIYWEGRIEAKNIWSTDPAKRRFAPSVRFDLSAGRSAMGCACSVGRKGSGAIISMR